MYSTPSFRYICTLDICYRYLGQCINDNIETDIQYPIFQGRDNSYCFRFRNAVDTVQWMGGRMDGDLRAEVVVGEMDVCMYS